jgi:competence protein ComEA
MSRTFENEATAARRPAWPIVLPQTRAGLGLALIFAAVGGGSLYTFRPRAAEPVARDRAALRLDPNIASRAELMLLPGIGPAVSRHIMEHREHCTTRPAYRRAEDLDAVQGIGPATLARLRAYLQFGPPQKGTAADEPAAAAGGL